MRLLKQAESKSALYFISFKNHRFSKKALFCPDDAFNILKCFVIGPESKLLISDCCHNWRSNKIYFAFCTELHM